MKTVSTTSIQNVPSSKGAIRRLFENPALIPGEYASDYRAFAKQVCAALDVQNILEGIQARDIVNLDWEMQRWRKLSTALLTPPAPTLSHIGTLEAAWGKDYAQSTIDAANQRFKGPEALAKRFVAHASELEQVDRTIAGLEIRRNNAWREFQRNREGTKRRSPLVSDDVLEAEYVEMPRKAA
jgi:hypothetical protein